MKTTNKNNTNNNVSELRIWYPYNPTYDYGSTNPEQLEVKSNHTSEIIIAKAIKFYCFPCYFCWCWLLCCFTLRSFLNLFQILKQLILFFPPKNAYAFKGIQKHYNKIKMDNGIFKILSRYNFWMDVRILCL